MATKNQYGVCSVARYNRARAIKEVLKLHPLGFNSGFTFFDGTQSKQST